MCFKTNCSTIFYCQLQANFLSKGNMFSCVPNQKVIICLITKNFKTFKQKSDIVMIYHQVNSLLFPQKTYIYFQGFSYFSIFNSKRKALKYKKKLLLQFSWKNTWKLFKILINCLSQLYSHLNHILGTFDFTSCL